MPLVLDMTPPVVGKFVVNALMVIDVTEDPAKKRGMFSGNFIPNVLLICPLTVTVEELPLSLRIKVTPPVKDLVPMGGIVTVPSPATKVPKFKVVADTVRGMTTLALAFIVALTMFVALTKDGNTATMPTAKTESFIFVFREIN